MPRKIKKPQISVTCTCSHSAESESAEFESIQCPIQVKSEVMDYNWYVACGITHNILCRERYGILQELHQTHSSGHDTESWLSKQPVRLYDPYDKRP